MTITVNGESKDFESSLNVLGLLEGYSLNPEATAVQLNEDILVRESFGATALKEGDRIELIRIVGGG